MAYSVAAASSLPIFASTQPIQTFVFSHWHTTGFSEPANITQICFKAVPRSQLESSNASTEWQQLWNTSQGIHFTLNPMKEIELGAQGVSGLNNVTVSGMPTFAQVFLSLEAFLLSLPKPVCLVMHSGNTYLYPVLARVLRDEAPRLFPADLYCVSILQCLGEKFPMLPNHSLETHFSHLFGMPPSCVSSETKCKLLIQLFLSQCSGIVSFCEQKKKLFSSVNPRRNLQPVQQSPFQ